MAKVIDHKTQAVTLGVIDKDLQVHEDLGQVTFDDVHGTRHTVQYHKDGPFKSPEEVVAAFEDGTLHTFSSHETAAAYERDRGNHQIAERLDSLAAGDNADTGQTERSGY